jgi:hypothetical protein
MPRQLPWQWSTLVFVHCMHCGDIRNDGFRMLPRFCHVLAKMWPRWRPRVGQDAAKISPHVGQHVAKIWVKRVPERRSRNGRGRVPCLWERLRAQRHKVAREGGRPMGRFWGLRVTVGMFFRGEALPTLFMTHSPHLLKKTSRNQVARQAAVRFAAASQPRPGPAASPALGGFPGGPERGAREGFGPRELSGSFSGGGRPSHPRTHSPHHLFRRPRGAKLQGRPCVCAACFLVKSLICKQHVQQTEGWG